MTTIINQDQINNYNLFILDPLSTIIKLAIISFKPIGTKISICNNLIGIQEPGLFQPIVRFVFKNNKTSAGSTADARSVPTPSNMLVSIS